MFALGVKWIEKLWLGLFFGDTPLANTTQMLIYEQAALEVVGGSRPDCHVLKREQLPFAKTRGGSISGLLIQGTGYEGEWRANLL